MRSGSATLSQEVRKMIRTVHITGLIAALDLTFGVPTLAATPGPAQVTEEERLALTQKVPTLGQEVAMLDAHLHGFLALDDYATEPLEVPFNPHCTGLSDALMVDGGARALCM
jgi:hypothetical protein